MIPCDHIEAKTRHYYSHVIFSDDHALRTISAYAGEGAVNRTPNLDRLAAEGAIFTRSFCGNYGYGGTSGDH